MSDVDPLQPPPPPPEPTPPPGPAAPEPSPVPPSEPILPKEIDDGKALAIIGYALNLIGLPLWVIPLIMRDNAFSLYHAKQAMTLWLAGVVIAVANGVLTIIPIVGCITLITWPVFIITLVVLDLIGLVSAAKGRVEPVPFVGRYAEEWFTGIRKAG